MLYNDRIIIMCTYNFAFWSRDYTCRYGGTPLPPFMITYIPGYFIAQNLFRSLKTAACELSVNEPQLTMIKLRFPIQSKKRFELCKFRFFLLVLQLIS